VDLSPWYILKLTHQRAAPDRGRSLISTIALFVLRHGEMVGHAELT